MFAAQLKRLVDAHDTPAPGSPAQHRARGVAPAAYDTACVARVAAPGAPGVPAYPRALEWLLARQYGDGTWGGPVHYHHDRVVSTLAAMVALAQWREAHDAGAGFSERIDAAAWGLGPHLHALERDPQATRGFDAIAGRLLAEARFFGVALPWTATGRLVGATAASAMPSPDAAARASRSPAAAAARLRNDPDDVETRRWLTAVVNDNGGAAPAGAGLDDLDVIETAWVLHAVSLLPEDPALVAPALRAPLDALAETVAGEPLDLAAAALAFGALAWAGRAPDPALLLRFERPDHFGGGPGGAPPSVIAHALLLAALRSSGAFPGRERATRKAIGLLARTCTPDHHWLDPRHASPFLPTALAVMALGPQLTLAVEAVKFLRASQRSDGSWGYFDAGTAEETAWCLLALSRFSAEGGRALVTTEALQAGARWLVGSSERRAGSYAPLWLGESLFCPTRMVEATVLAALSVTS